MDPGSGVELFMKPWFPSLTQPGATMSVSTTPLWMWLSNLPIHVWEEDG